MKEIIRLIEAYNEAMADGRWIEACGYANALYAEGYDVRINSF